MDDKLPKIRHFDETKVFETEMHYFFLQIAESSFGYTNGINITQCPTPSWPRNGIRFASSFKDGALLLIPLFYVQEK